MSLRATASGEEAAPSHPTVLLVDDNRDLLQFLERLMAESGWELIAAPELVIAAAAERTKHIKLGSGVTSLPYHHPLMVAQRWVQLDHMTRGRAMLGCAAALSFTATSANGVTARYD